GRHPCVDQIRSLPAAGRIAPSYHLSPLLRSSQRRLCHQPRLAHPPFLSLRQCPISCPIQPWTDWALRSGYRAGRCAAAAAGGPGRLPEPRAGPSARRVTWNVLLVPLAAAQEVAGAALIFGRNSVRPRMLGGG